MVDPNKDDQHGRGCATQRLEQQPVCILLLSADATTGSGPPRTSFPQCCLPHGTPHCQERFSLTHMCAVTSLGPVGRGEKSSAVERSPKLDLFVPLVWLGFRGCWGVKGAEVRRRSKEAAVSKLRREARRPRRYEPVRERRGPEPRRRALGGLGPSAFLAGEVSKPPTCTARERGQGALSRTAALLPHAQEGSPRREGPSTRRGRGTEGRTPGRPGTVSRVRAGRGSGSAHARFAGPPRSPGLRGAGSTGSRLNGAGG